jgi:hypothetical protein
MMWLRTVLFGLVSWTLAASPVLAADRAPDRPQEARGKSGFLRLTKDEKQRPVALEAAIVRFAAKDRRGGATVDLVAAVHVAEKSYYEQINREFEKYDVVLYELVAPEGTKIPKGGRKGSSNPVSMLQTGMKNLLELDFQLDDVDYTRKNLVHADMSPEQFSKSMKDRGESFWDLFARMMGYAIAKQSQNPGGTSDAQLLMALFDKDRALALKRIMAEQFEDLEGSMAALEGPKGSTIITQRNKAALEVLQKQIAAGKKKIAIFYGAGHMPDFQKRLRDEFGLTPVSTRWLVAWDLKDKKK